VAPPEASVVGKNITIIERFCRGLSLCSRRQHFSRNGVEYIVFCFEQQMDAGYFQKYFGGEFMPPETRPRRYPKQRRPLGMLVVASFHDCGTAYASGCSSLESHESLSTHRRCHV
jgi:hypothetical protein